MTGSDGQRSRARPAWRWAWCRAPTSSARWAAARSSPTACSPMFAADARHGPDLGDEFGGRGRVVGQLIDRRLRHVCHRRRSAGVALRTDQLGERLVGDLAHHVAAESATADRTVVGDVEQAVVDEDRRGRLGRRPAPVSDANSMQRLDRARRAEDGRIVEHRPWPGGQADRASTRSRHAATPAAPYCPAATRDQGREFGEEERIPAAAFVEPVDEGVRCGRRRAIASTSSWDSSRDSGSSGMRIVMG